jgi:tetratricopeptide (TPR) repeat protein
MNPYEVLEVSSGASADEIKAAYHSLAKQWHPDRFTGDAKVEAEQRFRMLAEAYNMIKDTPRRVDAATPAPSAPSGPAKPPVQIQLDHNSGAEKPLANKTVDEWYQDAKAAAEHRLLEKALSLIQYAIRLDGERAEFHALLGKLLYDTNGDKRALVRALETALRINPKDVESAILLAETFQALGMHARASRLWSTVHNLAPNHAVFSPVAAQGGGKPAKNRDTPSLREQLSSLVAEAKLALDRIFKRG